MIIVEVKGVDKIFLNMFPRAPSGGEGNREEMPLNLPFDLVHEVQQFPAFMKSEKRLNQKGKKSSFEPLCIPQVK